MPINPTTLRALVDTQITNETVDFAITPAEVGSRLKDSIDYTTEQSALAEKLTNKSTDVASDGSSNTKYPSVKAVKDYADGLVVGLLDDRGNYNASVNTFPASGGSGVAGAVMKGDLWYISVAGTLGGVSVPVGASVRALVDTPAQTSGNWSVLNVGIGFTPENEVNKSVDVVADAASDIKYPSVKAVKTYVDANGGGSQVTKTVKISLSSADILTLFSNPVTLLTGVAGKIFIPRFVFQDYTFVSANYVTSTVVRLSYDSASIWVAQFGLHTPNFNDGQAISAINPNTNTQGFTYSGKNLLLSAITANPTGGDGTSNFYLTYDEITL